MTGLILVLIWITISLTLKLPKYCQELYSDAKNKVKYIIIVKNKEIKVN